MSMLVEKLCVSYFVFYIFWSVDVDTSEIHDSMLPVLHALLQSHEKFHYFTKIVPYEPNITHLACYS